MSRNKVLITTAIDYTNDVIHAGQAYQKVLADCLVRYYRQKIGKDNVFFSMGTDEYGTTNEKAAKERGLEPKEHCDEIVQKDKEQWKALNLSYNRFIRTTDPDHQKITQEFFKKSYDAGDIYKSKYQGLYCEGCEAYKTLSELDSQGQCLLHPTRQIQKTDEENYFFRWSKYTNFLKDVVNQKSFVLPEGKRKEMLSFIKQGISDIPITRPKYKVSWGIPCPVDNLQVIYVWFDALINYYTAGSKVGFWDKDTIIIHFLGKDNARWHSLLWPAMLKSVGLRLPNSVYIHSFITLNGQKISKSRGNIIRPTELTKKFGSDAVRYYLLKYGPLLDDIDISIEKLKEVYTVELANNLGNLVSRVGKLLEGQKVKSQKSKGKSEGKKLKVRIQNHIEKFRPDLALQEIQLELGKLNKYVQENKPWEKSGEERLAVLKSVLLDLLGLSETLEPFIPETAKKIKGIFAEKTIKAVKPLFPKL